MNKPMRTKRLLIIISVLALLFLSLLLLGVFHRTTPAPVPSQESEKPEEVTAITDLTLEKQDLVETQYKGEEPDYEEWSRVTNSTRPVRYEKTGDYYTYSTPTSPNTARIMCAGDLMCEPAMSRAAFLNDKFFFETCFAKIRKVFDAADFAVANLETCVDPDSPYALDIHKLSDRYHCNAPTEYLEAIRYAGLDAVVMANNHSCDTGATGLRNTINNVEAQGLIHTGTFTSPDDKRYFIVDINGIRVAFLSYAQHYNSQLDEKCFTEEGREVMLNLYSQEKVEKDLKDARADGAEFTIVYIHFWCKDYPDDVLDSQIKCANEIAEAGADCIIGGHPHLVQRYDEIITSSGKRVPVTYSLGNFITSDYHTITRTNYIYELFLEKDENGTVRIADEMVIPCKVVETLEKSGFTVFPTPENWREGKESESLQKAEEDIMLHVGNKIRIDTNDPE